MGRVYAVPFSAVAVTAAQDLVEASPGDDLLLRLIGWKLFQTSDHGDAQAEGLSLTVIRGHTVAGSGGTSVTPARLDPTDSAATFTAKVNNTTVASSGTPITVQAGGWNLQAGADEYLPEELRPVARQSDGTLVVRMSAPADSITASGVFYFQEG